jgi:hypothetical protein
MPAPPRGAGRGRHGDRGDGRRRGHGHDPTTGKELWRAEGLNPTNDPYYRIVASPVAVKDGIRPEPGAAGSSRCARADAAT